MFWVDVEYLPSLPTSAVAAGEGAASSTASSTAAPTASSTAAPTIPTREEGEGEGGGTGMDVGVRKVRIWDRVVEGGFPGIFSLSLSFYPLISFLIPVIFHYLLKRGGRGHVSVIIIIEGLGADIYPSAVETKILKRRVRDLVMPEKGLGHNDRDHGGEAATASASVGVRGAVAEGDGDGIGAAATSAGARGGGDDEGGEAIGQKALNGLVEGGMGALVERETGMGVETGGGVAKERCEDCG